MFEFSKEKQLKRLLKAWTWKQQIINETTKYVKKTYTTVTFEEKEIRLNKKNRRQRKCVLKPN